MRKVAESMAKPATPDPKVPKITPAMPAPTTPPMTCEACASEFATGSASAGTTCGSIAPRAGRKNVAIDACVNPRTYRRGTSAGLWTRPNMSTMPARSRSAASMTRRRSQRST